MVALEAPEAAWFADLTGDVIVWRRGRHQAAVTVRGTLTDPLLAIYRRKAAPEVHGDAQLLDLWLSHIGFGS